MSERRDPSAVLQTPRVVAALDASADAVTARGALSRILESHPELSEPLVGERLLRDGLIAITAVSRSLAAAIVSDAELVIPLRDEKGFHREQSLQEYRAASIVALPHDHDNAEARRALRRWKRRELLRTAARDLLTVADLPAVGRELAALAQACLERSVGLAAPGMPFAVIGMGKLGGSELNYASDVDVLFVHEGDADVAEHVARAILGVMTEPTADGIVFRTDADLRPEGRSGPLSRSLDSYGAYYDRWAQTWEFQALLKARPVGGDANLADRFLALVAPHVWPDALDAAAVREVRAMKARAEAETRKKGLTERELKRGRGGIRDIEFAVQLLQLVHGRHDQSVRSRNTLEALGQLATAGYVEVSDATRLDRSYQFLRTVEHRLQLHDEQQTHTVPSDVATRTRLA
ncbi:MAG TPA: bifunctional glutamine-synthetase adenylyltransferase/deadenyltransferase, partial [Acidimicrobiia bacterium]|nr:bifunctional glutamine-synthetase adenylyltransferase/deadenyltransferase [Acidimicrobiia bacterium]